ncbi:septal ring lytic transglycosylase RlpA family protein [Psychroflexus tropicus]|uniref:septal ring lytic transglycosylase RlpA family protein n=1 Tax=Psychroflexus tropicus TaxID=197345 RepID=UPI001B7FF090|nr:septal ring lytic transglycosylase RlpA family protein [Psychroflexus tropicus]
MKTLILGIGLILSQLILAQTQTGKASFYADKFEGRPTASGEIYRHNLATAAHRKLPFGTKVKVTNLSNNRTALVTINDRGPFIRGRIIDLSRSVAQSLGVIESGVTNVQIQVLDNNVTIKSDEAEYVSPSVTEKEKPQVAEKNSRVQKSTSENFEKTNSSSLEEREFYELTVDEIQPDYFGVQIASFQESDNLLRLANRLKISYKSEVLIQIKTINETKVYTVILGQFNSRRAAENFKSRNLDKYPDSFIVDMTVKQ